MKINALLDKILYKGAPVLPPTQEQGVLPSALSTDTLMPAGCTSDLRQSFPVNKTSQPAPTAEEIEIENVYTEAQNKSREFERNNRHNVQSRLDVTSEELDNALKEAHVDFEKLQTLISQFIRLHMRDVAKTHKEYIQTSSKEIRAQAELIRDTHNNIWGVSLTLIGAGIGIAGGVAALSFLLPTSLISLDKAKAFGVAAQSITGVSTSFSSVAGIFDQKYQGKRGMYEYLKRDIETRKEHTEETKRRDGKTSEDARDLKADVDRKRHDAIAAVLS